MPGSCDGRAGHRGDDTCFPTLGMTVWHQMRHDVEGTFANVRAFNRWMEDDWGYDYGGRIFAAPFLSLLDVDLAVTELDRVLGAARGSS